MEISTCVKFKGGFPVPTEIQLAPGKELAARVLAGLRKQGIESSGPLEHEVGNTIPCKIGVRKYEVEVAFDWVTNEWWEVMYAPSLGMIARLFGAGEVSEMQSLTRAIDAAIREIQGITEVRWYPSYPSHPDKGWSPSPVGI
jgi:hypothetical protein